MAQPSDQTTFYNHYSKDRPTGLGKRLAASVTKRIFDFAGIREGCSVLEIGPGRGALANLCLSKGIDYWAIEPNDDMATNLESKGANVTRSIVPPIPPLGKTFDVIIMTSVMEHMDTMTQALEVSENAREMLKEGGRFVLYTPDYPNWGQHFYIGDFSHSYVTSWRRLKGLLISAGFSDIQGRYQTSVFTGVFGFLISVFASWLPFAQLDIMFPDNRLLGKLYKVQITFLRRVLIMGIK
jgi:SAM-dependent methyltransferase